MGGEQQRKSISIKSLSHVAPIPVATRIGPLLVCSIIAPYAAGTRTAPPGAEAQVENLFLHMASVLHEAGGDWTDVAKITFFAPDVGAVIGMINAAWTRHFPDEASRPSRHCQTVPAYGDGILVCCEFLAFLPD